LLSDPLWSAVAVTIKACVRMPPGAVMVAVQVIWSPGTNGFPSDVCPGAIPEGNVSTMVACRSAMPVFVMERVYVSGSPGHTGLGAASLL
jgi:hypothetical protein